MAGELGGAADRLDASTARLARQAAAVERSRRVLRELAAVAVEAGVKVAAEAALAALDKSGR